MSKKKLKAVNEKIKVKIYDTRTHAQKLAAMWEAFGELKERAKRSGKVNDCSINKIADLSSVHPNIVKCARPYEDEDINAKYEAFKNSVKEWKKGFVKVKETTVEQDLINQQKIEISNLKESIEPILKEKEQLKLVLEKIPKQAGEASEQITILYDQLQQEKDKSQYDSKVKNFGMATNVSRMRASPDDHRLKDGKYVFDKDTNQKAVLKAYEDLEKHLSRDLPMRLYVLVGLPCSGKTTWVKNAKLNPDRHPVIYDATNLTLTDRRQLIHELRHYKDLEICCVVFDIPMTEIRKRNLHNRISDRQIPDDVLDAMNSSFKRPDPYKETWIDELIVVRS